MSISSQEGATSIEINGARLLNRLNELSEVGRNEVSRTRLALTKEDMEARGLLRTWMEEANLDISVDPAGNLFGLLPGAERCGQPVMIGSHIDTVVNAGHLDGCLGVLAGLEVLQTMREQGIVPRRSMVLAAFTNEEGVRFSPDLMGSRYYTGELALETLRAAVDENGLTAGQALDQIEIGGELPLFPLAYVELHIEQGPVLANLGLPLGIVKGVQGCRRFNVVVRGRSNHAGTTPMDMRHDAMTAAAELVLGLTSRAWECHLPTVASVGTFRIVDGCINSIAAEVRFTIDFRDFDERMLDHAEIDLRAAIEVVEKTHRVRVELEFNSMTPAREFDEELVERACTIADRDGLNYQLMVSGASHDAQALSNVCPTLMIFAASKNGISHSPDEHTDDDIVVKSAHLLHLIVRDLADRA